MGKGFILTWNPTSSGGTVSSQRTTWTQIINGSVKLNQVVIKATRADTIFDFKITAPSGNFPLHRKNIDGTLNERPELVMRGTYTLTIENVKNGEGTTVDDSFTGDFTFQELKNK